MKYFLIALLIALSTNVSAWGTKKCGGGYGSCDYQPANLNTYDNPYRRQALERQQKQDHQQWGQNYQLQKINTQLEQLNYNNSSNW